jgi:succinate dehydrogenase / fumarate reductase iron-sulfur subunit
MLKDDLNIGLCNITKCCTEVCPEHIHITDNGIIPLKERVVDQFYDPLVWLWRKVTGRKDERVTLKALPVVSAPVGGE